MKGLGPTLAVILTLDLHLAALLLLVNSALAAVLTHQLFRARPIAEKGLLWLGLALLLNTAGFLAMHLAARAPVREFQAFVVD